MKEIKFVVPENGEKLSANASELHAELLKLPADMYVELYHMMKNKMENNFSTSGYCISTGSIPTSAIQV